MSQPPEPGESFRCAAASLEDAEPLAGTAPTDTAFLLVEHPGPWGRKAVEESNLPADVRRHLAAQSGLRVQLIRRHGRSTGTGLRVFAAWLGDGSGATEPWVATTVVDRPEALLELDLASVAAGRNPGLAAYDAPLWLVCTNGRRDRCCAELGRPVAAALAARWPEETWETTHLGGHRFASTLLALPTGITLGRLTATEAVDVVAEVAAGGHPVRWSRGRAGRPPQVQAAELALLAEGASEARWVPPIGAAEREDGVTVRLRTPDGERRLDVVAVPGPARRQSCEDPKTKSTARYEVRLR